MLEKRALLAIALSVGVLLAWQMWFAPPSPKPSGPPGAATPVPGAGPATPAPETESSGAAPPEATSSGGWTIRPGVAVATEVAATVETPLYRIEFGPDGTARSWTLEYRGAKPLVVGDGLGPLAVGLVRPSGPGVEIVSLKPERSSVATGVGGNPVALEFAGQTADGIRVRKRLDFRSDAFEIGVRVELAGPIPTGVRPVLYWRGPVSVGGAKAGDPQVTLGETPDHRQLLGRILIGRRGRDPAVFDAPSPAVRDGHPGSTAAERPELKVPNLVEPGSAGPDATWAALENDFFIAALVPAPGAEMLRGRDRDEVNVGVVLGAGRESGVEGAGVRLYVGPKEWERLAALGVGLEAAQARNYGHFLGTWAQLWTPPMWWFCLPLLWLLNFFGTHVPGRNYGVAIILLTVLVKAVFYPLAQKSMRSMKQMQALQPQLNALKSKFRSDPQRFQREQMELFRKHGVNPMGGCLPMVVQIPIFYALYLTLQYSVELHGAPFFLWIHDLSKKDPYYVLPILMGASMLLQQKMTPTVADPRQARVMLIMPVVFTFMFLEFPTGLVLYWLVNNVLSVAQQYLIDRAVAARTAGEGRIERDARRA
jgi:YidC/Oxa1 family membrane protein insertase